MTDPSLSTTHGTPSGRCTARTPRGPCEAHPVRGSTVCIAHGAAAPQVRAMAAVRAEVMRWGLGDTGVDPGEMLLRLLTQSAARAERYAFELSALVEQHGGDVPAAMIGDTLVVTRDGVTVKAGEYIRGLVQLEAQERDRCASFAAKAVAAGLAERQVRLAEGQATIVLEAIEAALDALGVPAMDRGPAKVAAARILRLIDVSGADGGVA